MKSELRDDPDSAQRLARSSQAADRHARCVRWLVLRMQYDAYSQRKMVAELNRLGIPTVRGERWHLATVQALLKRLDAMRARDALQYLIVTAVYAINARLADAFVDLTELV